MTVVDQVRANVWVTLLVRASAWELWRLRVARARSRAWKALGIVAGYPVLDAVAILWRPIGNGVADHTNLRKCRLGALDADIDVGGGLIRPARAISHRATTAAARLIFARTAVRVACARCCPEVGGWIAGDGADAVVTRFAAARESVGRSLRERVSQALHQMMILGGGTARVRALILT